MILLAISPRLAIKSFYKDDILMMKFNQFNQFFIFFIILATNSSSFSNPSSISDKYLSSSSILDIFILYLALLIIFFENQQSWRNFIVLWIQYFTLNVIKLVLEDSGFKTTKLILIFTKSFLLLYPSQDHYILYQFSDTFLLCGIKKVWNSILHTILPLINLLIRFKGLYKHCSQRVILYHRTIHCIPNHFEL